MGGDDTESGRRSGRNYTCWTFLSLEGSLHAKVKLLTVASVVNGMEGREKRKKVAM